MRELGDVVALIVGPLVNLLQTIMKIAGEVATLRFDKVYTIPHYSMVV